MLTSVLIAAIAAATAVALGASGALLAGIWTGACLISVGGAATLAFSTLRAMRGGNAEVVDR